MHHEFRGHRLSELREVVCLIRLKKRRTPHAITAKQNPREQHVVLDEKHYKRVRNHAAFGRPPVYLSRKGDPQ